MEELLKRVSPDTLIQLQEPERLPGVVAAARAELGYRPRREAAEQLEKAHASNKIALRVLTELDARPFDPKSVVAYKRRQLPRWRHALDWVLDMLDIATRAMFLGGLVVMLIALIVAGVSYLVSGGAAGYVWVTVIAAGCTAAAGLAIGLSIFAIPLANWEQTSFAKYEEEIPEYALQTALDIKRRWGTADLRIERLVHTRDPFLVLVLPGTKPNTTRTLHLEVWREPSFRAKRIEVEDALA